MPTVTEILATMEYGPAPEGTAEVRAWLDARGGFGHFIAGRFCAPGDAPHPLGVTLAEGTGDDVAAAIAAARAAQPGWQALPDVERARWLFAIARRLQDRAQFLIILETLETGRPVREARAHLSQAVRQFRHHAGRALSRGGRLPHGVCAQILSAQAPLATLAGQIAPALAAANAVVAKPAPETPLTALALAEICAEIGLPEGVLNIVLGDGGTGAALVSAHPDRIAATGTGATMRAIARAATGIPLSLDPEPDCLALILDDADIDAAVQGITTAWPTRALVAEAVQTALAKRLAARMDRLRTGSPLDRGTDTPTLPVAPQIATFRTLPEALQLAQATSAPITAAIWSETLATALDAASRMPAVTVWINSIGTTDTLPDRFEDHLRPEAPRALPEPETGRLDAAPDPTPPPAANPDQTAALRIGGTGKRPESGQIYRTPQGFAPIGSRKDIRNAVEAAAKATGWAGMAGPDRAQLLCAIAETLTARRNDFELLAPGETDPTIEAALHAAAWADSLSGRLPSITRNTLTLDLPEPLGIIGIACQNAQPLLGLAALLFPAIAAGNRVTAIPAQSLPLAGLALGRLIDETGAPPGVVNIVSGPRDDLARSLAQHDAVASLWYCGSVPAEVERACAETLKPFWAPAPRLWTARPAPETLGKAVRRKTVWLPYGS